MNVTLAPSLRCVLSDVAAADVDATAAFAGELAPCCCEVGVAALTRRLVEAGDAMGGRCMFSPAEAVFVVVVVVCSGACSG